MTTEPDADLVFSRVLLRWPDVRRALPGPQAVERVPGGLINATFRADGWIVQRLHAVFGPSVNHDLAALLPRLRSAGVPVPAIVPAADGAPCAILRGEGAADGVWRVLTRLPGRTLHRVERPGQVRAAGEALARFHSALVGCDHRFAFARLGIHDTAAHIARLEAALAAHASHRLAGRVGALAETILSRWRALEAPPPLPPRVGHGDPKISNLLFDDHDHVVGVIDLDTLGLTTLDAELGDALRSWCSSADESATAPRFDLVRFEAGMQGYLPAAAAWLTSAEIASVPAGVERICTELSARFAADALEERYFGWDPTVAATRGEHNALRAANQLTLAIDAAGKADAMRRSLARIAATVGHDVGPANNGPISR